MGGAPSRFAITFSEEIRMKFSREYRNALKRELWPLIGIINISQLKLMSSNPKRQ
jgi:hypothetical protein